MPRLRQSPPPADPEAPEQHGLRERIAGARALGGRAGPFVSDAAERGRSSARVRGLRVVRASRTLLQTALAASLAWFIAREVLGHAAPFFAPVSAIITLGITVGERGRRAVELAVGVAVGIAVADLFILAIGPGPVQLALVVGLAMGAALLLGSGQLLATQAAVSAALVATIEPPSDGVSFARFLDALIGGGVALAIQALVLPVDPLALARDNARPVLRELAAALEDLAAALRDRDRSAAERALLRARGIDALFARFASAVRAARETVRLAPPRRRARAIVETYAEAAGQIDLAVRNVRVLARGTLRAVRSDENVPPGVAEALDELAEAVRALEAALERPEEATRVRAHALGAAARATRVLQETGNLSVSVIVGQVRSTAVDLLRGAGLTYEEAAEAVRRAVREDVPARG